jgi:hypothetical protein
MLQIDKTTGEPTYVGEIHCFFDLDSGYTKLTIRRG